MIDEWKLDYIEFVGEIPLKDGEFIFKAEKIGEKYWILHAQTESFVLEFDTKKIKRALKIGDATYIV